MPRAVNRWSIALAGVLFVRGTGTLSGQEPSAPATSSSSTAPALASPAIVLDKIEDQVSLTFIDRHEIAFDRPGVLQFVVEEGETVTAGQVVARLKNETAVAALAVAAARVLNTAEIDSARKQAEAATQEYQAALDSNERNRKRNLTPTYEQTAVEQLRLASEASTIEIERFVKEHAVNEKNRDQAQAELLTYEVKAPREGIVTRAFKQTGEGVQVGETVVEIISTKRLRAEAQIDLAIAPLLKVGAPVTVVVQFPTIDQKTVVERFTTTLKFIDPTVDQSSQRVRIWAEVDNTSGKLREGLPSSLEIVP